MFSPSDWPSLDEDFHFDKFNENQKNKKDIDLVAEAKKKMEQDRKQTNWELELEKIRNQFMSSTPFKTRLTSDRINTYDGNTGRQELQEAKNKVLSDFSNASFHKDARENLFRVEFDVYDFDPNTVKVKLEDETLVVEAKQQTQEGDAHRCKREFYRRVVLPLGANSDRMLCNLSAAGVLEVKIPAPPSYSEAFKDCTKTTIVKQENTPSTRDQSYDVTDNTINSTTLYVPSTPTFTSVSTPKRVTIRTKEYVPQYTRSSSEYRPSTFEYSYSTKKSPSPRSYSRTTTEYIPGNTRYVSSSSKYSPSSMSNEYTPGISKRSSGFTGFSPTKYSTLPTRPKARSSSGGSGSTARVYLGRSGTNTIDPKWRRQHKISLSDSLDSEATLSSSPSDDLYYGHSSFSDLDL